MAAAIGWGALAASSLILGALLGLARKWPDRVVGLVLAFGAGALISAVSFDLAEEGLEIGSPGAVASGLAVGALAFYVLDGAFDRGGTNALALGAFLDGIPEQLVLGIGLAAGDGVSLGLLAAIFVSNLPEAIGSSTAMREAGSRPAAIRRLWGLIAARVLHRHARRLRHRRRHRRRPPGRHQRVCRRRPARDADRLDDPRGAGTRPAAPAAWSRCSASPWPWGSRT